MTDRGDDGGVLGFLKRIHLRIVMLGGLVTAIAGGLFAFIPDRFIAWLAAVTAVPWLILLYVCTETERKTHDSRKKRHKYGKRKRRAALAGVLVLPMAVGLIIWNHLRIPPLQCPPLTVTVTRFKGDDNVARRIQSALVLNLTDEGNVMCKRRDFVVSPEGTKAEWIDAAKKYAKTREGQGNIVIWGEVLPEVSPAFGAIANKCYRSGAGRNIVPQTPRSARTDEFKFDLKVSGNVESDIIAFAKFVIGVALYEEGRVQESVAVFAHVRSPFGAFYQGLALEKLGHTSEELKQAIRAYERCVGSWENPAPGIDIQSKAIAVAAYINASNVLAALSDLEPESAKSHLEAAFSGYKEAIERYQKLKEEIEQHGHSEQNVILPANWLTIAQTNLAIAKIRLAAGYQERAEWLRDAEQDFNNILKQLEQNHDSDREGWAIAHANLGNLCVQLARVEPERKKRLVEAEDHLSKALAELDRIYDCDQVTQNEGAYDCAVLKSNLGTVFWERALDAPSREEALEYLSSAEANYVDAMRLFSADPANSVESAEEMSNNSRVLIERARWFENGERERLLRNAVQHSTQALRNCSNDLTLEWALITNDLARAQRELGKTLGDSELLNESVKNCDKSLTGLSYEFVYRRGDWAAAQLNLGDSYYELGVASGDVKQVIKAMIAYEDARRVWTPRNARYDWIKATEAMQKARNFLVTMGVRPGTN